MILPTKRHVLLITCLLLVHHGPMGTHAASLADVENLYTAIFTGYHRHILPVLDQDSAVQINVSASIISLNNFDDISGEIALTIGLRLSWVDERITWTPATYGGKNSLLAPSVFVWRPELYLVNAADRIEVFGNQSLSLRIFSSGLVEWRPGQVVRAICSVDVTYFPFDTQECMLTYMATSSTSSELNLSVYEPDVDLSLFSLNSQWEVLSSTATSANIGRSAVAITLVLKRRSLFFLIYIIFPILFMGLINNMVFLIPPTAGERSSVAVTTFLSFVVYMSIINNTVPESSSPMSFLYYYLLFLMFYSSTIMLASIFTLRLYDKEGPVPNYIVSLTRTLRFQCVSHGTKRVNPEQVDTFRGELSVDNLSKDPSASKEDTANRRDVTVMEEVTWKLFARTLDFYLSACLFLVYTVMSMVCLLLLQTNSGI